MKLITTPLTPLIISYENPIQKQNHSYIYFLIYDISCLVFENCVICNDYQ